MHSEAKALVGFGLVSAAALIPAIPPFRLSTFGVGP